jgi:hypothetical protein
LTISKRYRDPGDDRGEGNLVSFLKVSLHADVHLELFVLGDVVGRQMMDCFTHMCILGNVLDLKTCSTIVNYHNRSLLVLSWSFYFPQHLL